MRSDPAIAAANIINFARRRALALKCLASTGIITAFPGSVNTIPEKVVFSLDLRSRDVQSLRNLELALQQDVNWNQEKQQRKGRFSVSRLQSSEKEEKAREMEAKLVSGHCLVEWQTDSVSDAVKFDESCIKCVEDSVRSSFGAESTLEDVSERMTSGAGSFLTPHPCPTRVLPNYRMIGNY